MVEGREEMARKAGGEGGEVSSQEGAKVTEERKLGEKWEGREMREEREMREKWEGEAAREEIGGAGRDRGAGGDRGGGRR